MNSPPSICVSDQFHFSHYYWKDSTASNLDQLCHEEEQTEATSTQDSHSTCSDAEHDTYFKPKEVVAGGAALKLKFYSQVLEDGSRNIHFGKWDGIAMDSVDAYRKATEEMTDYMFDLSLSLLPHRQHAPDFKYIDLGSGNGASALRIVEEHLLCTTNTSTDAAAKTTATATCLNCCHEQNIQAENLARLRGVGDKVDIVEGDFEDAPFSDQTFDLAFSQDAFIHAISKTKVYSEAYRITRPGGAFVFCDLMAGETCDYTQAELERFEQENVLNDFLTPEENKTVLYQVGWKEVHWIDLTSDMRISFQLMLKKVNFTLEHGHLPSNAHRVTLSKYSQKIKDRLVQIDRGVFKWCVFHCRKPVVLHLACKPPVPFLNDSSLIVHNEQHDSVHGTVEDETTTVVVIDILKKMTREKIAQLPKSVELLITLSAGLDHIDMAACQEHGITVRQSGRQAITSHVVQYTLGFLVLGLREAFSQIGVPFPKSGWDLNWNCQGKPLTDCKIAIVGMGMIALELVRQIRLLAPETTILYHVPVSFRDIDTENKHQLVYCSDLEAMAGQCDVLVPLCPLNKHTEHIINAKVLAQLRPEAGLLNMARGKVVDTDALTAALEKKEIKYAILDTTSPEPLPENHRLWELDNCFILPHYATNTMAVRKALVEEIQPIVEESFGLGRSDEKLRQQERVLRKDLAVAHQLTSRYGMDMLVWNHVSARFKTGCLITPGRKLWGSMQPSDLVYSSTNVTADIIHAAIYSARSDIKAIIHLHTPAATAVSCLESGFIPMTQDAAYFYNKVAHYEWDGVSDDTSEGPALTAAVRALPGCNTLLMHNHGFVCFGSSIKEAWVLAYYFERCCEVQLRVLQCGGKVKMPPTRVMAQAAESSYLPEFAPGVQEWEALCNEINFDEE